MLKLTVFGVSLVLCNLQQNGLPHKAFLTLLTQSLLTNYWNKSFGATQPVVYQKY
jgi:hypothetical protein